MTSLRRRCFRRPGDDDAVVKLVDVDVVLFEVIDDVGGGCDGGVATTG